MKGVIIIVFLLYLALLSWPLDQKKDISLYIHEFWETDDGLPSVTIFQIIDDKKGKIWIPTSHEVAKKNGKPGINLF